MRAISSVLSVRLLKIQSLSVDAVGGVLSPYKDKLPLQREDAQSQLM